jgi:hypothetical protein
MFYFLFFLYEQARNVPGPVIPAGKPESSHTEVKRRAGAVLRISQRATGRLPSMALDSVVHERNDGDDRPLGLVYNDESRSLRTGAKIRIEI